MNVIWKFTKDYILEYKKWYIAGAIFVIGTQLFTVEIIDLIKESIDIATAKNSHPSSIVPYVGKILIFATFLCVIRTLSRFAIFTPGRKIEYKLRNIFFSNLLYAKRYFINQFETGDLITRSSIDIRHIRMMYGFGFLQIINVLTTFIVVIHAMLRMDKQTTLYVMIPIIISIVIMKIGISAMLEYWKKTHYQLASLSSFCLSSYKGVSVIQGYHSEPDVEKQFADIDNLYLVTHKAAVKIASFVMPLIKLIGDLSIFFVLWFVGPQIIKSTLTLGQITAFIGYVAMLMPPLRSLGWMLNIFNRASISIERMNAILDATPQKQDRIKNEIRRDKHVTLQVRGMNFSYKKEENFKLQDISFTASQGKIIGITGKIGSGKTTCVENLMRINDISKGQIFLGEKDATTIPIQDYRRYFSYAPQHAFLFSTTLRENLRISLNEKEYKDDELDAKLLKYLEMCGLKISDEFFKEGLDTVVGEKGIMLSGGQRQRIALARALLKNANIYILDDVLSAVDYETEQLILENLRKFTADKTFIIISHRISAIQWADEILVLEDGQITERGKHEELIDKSDYYKKVYDYQLQLGKDSTV